MIADVVICFSFLFIDFRERKERREERKREKDNDLLFHLFMH